jgi:hypothetical protein
MPKDENPPYPNIGTLNENHLHAAIKAWYAKPNDRMEAGLEGYVVDILRGDLIIEIQTKSFSKIRRKLRSLLEDHLSRRKSPRRGTYEDLFNELVSMPALMKEPDFSLEVLLIHEEEIRIHDPHRAWRRRGWVTLERRLLDVIEKRCFDSPEDLMSFIPPSIGCKFTTSDLAAALQKSIRLAGKMAYCLRETGMIRPVGKRGRAILYTRS